ncbi:MAG: HEPN domain-containing protein, partial [Candidatus Thermoplasmatota archaeon]
MRRNLVAEGKRWLKQAENDFDDAKFSLGGKRYHLACFLAQQSAEKALKAYLYTMGEEELWTHSVAELCAMAGRFDAEFRKIKQESSALDKYYVPTRYPNALPGGVPSEA